jgi:hypothetical protein
MKIVAASLVGLLLLSGCSEKAETTASAIEPQVLHSCDGNAGKVVLASEAPTATEVHGNNVICVMSYLQKFDKNPHNGTKLPDDAAIGACKSVGETAANFHSDFQKGVTLNAKLAELKTFSSTGSIGNAVIGASMLKIAKYTWDNKQTDSTELRNAVEKECLQDPRAFFFIPADELKQYRVVGGPASPEQVADGKAQAIYQDAVSEAASKKAKFEEEVSACIAQATRDKAAAKDVNKLEIEAACRAGLK